MSDNYEIFDLYASQQCCILREKGITMTRLFLRAWSPWKWSEVEGKLIETCQDVRPPSGGIGPHQVVGVMVFICHSWDKAGLKKTQVKEIKNKRYSSFISKTYFVPFMQNKENQLILSHQSLPGLDWWRLGICNSTKSRAEMFSEDCKNLSLAFPRI